MHLNRIVGQENDIVDREEKMVITDRLTNWWIGTVSLAIDQCLEE